MKNFKALAKEKQADFIKNKTKFEKHSILADKDALNFQFVNWPGLIDEIKNRRNIYNKVKKLKMPYKNMLRSEHIPYNFFIPLKLHSNRQNVISFFENLLDRKDLLNIENIIVEWAPNKEEDLLEDKTSFDTYIQFELKNSKKLGVGIEVKFTEKSYPYTKTEHKRLTTENESSTYFKVWEKSQFYKRNSYLALGKKEYKQFFRNHLLGLSLISPFKSKINLDEFISLHLFPFGNSYQMETANEYINFILPKNKKQFKAVTFETFINIASQFLKDSESRNWLDYLQKRYVI